MAELALGRPIFAGKDEFDQFFSIMEVLGFPPAFLLENSPKCNVILEGIKKANLNNPSSGKYRIPGSKNLKQIINSNDALFYDFLCSKDYLECFVWDPNERFTAAEALEHE